MSNIIKAKLRLKNKIKSTLTTRWDSDEPIVTSDTGELFVGMGETTDSIKISDFIQVDTLPLVGIKNKIYIKRGEDQAKYWDGIKYNTISGKGGSILFTNYSSLPSTGVKDIIYIVKNDESFYPTTGSSLYIWDELNSKYILVSRANATNSFSKVNVDGIDIVANNLQDKINIKAGTGISLNTDVNNKTITINQVTPLSATIHKEQYSFNGGTKSNITTSLGIMSSAIVGSKVYLMGGYTGSASSNAFQCYDISTNTCSSIGTIPSARYQSMSFSYNGNIYMAGGFNGTVATKEFWMYNIETSSWLAKPQLNIARFGSFGALIGDKYWVIGGSINGSTRTGTIEYYDFNLEQWILLDSSKNMITTRFGGSTFVFDNMICCAGGYDASTYSLKNEVFDTENLVWISKANMPVNRYGGVSATYNGLGYVFAGRQTTTYTKTLYVYNPIADKWYLKENMVNARAFNCVERFGNTFYVFGGQVSATVNTNITEAYSTASSIVNGLATLSMITPVTGSILNTSTGESSRTLGLAQNDVWHYGAWDNSLLKVIITEAQS